MKNKARGEYPDDWPQISALTKDKAGWRCVRCGHPHENGKNGKYRIIPMERIPCDDLCVERYHPGGLNDGRQRVLTVHHLDGDKGNCAWWNLAALCQVCHLIIQAKVDMDQIWAFEHSEWFKPFVAGLYAHRMGLEEDREAVFGREDRIIEVFLTKLAGATA